jgi:predicted nucleotidyltransferase
LLQPISPRATEHAPNLRALIMKKANKPLLYVFRVLLTGIHLMRSGEVEANLVTLNEIYKLPYVPDLIARKLAGPEQSKLADADLEFYRSEYERLRAMLEEEHAKSSLPERATAGAALNDLLIRLRLTSPSPAARGLG